MRSFGRTSILALILLPAPLAGKGLLVSPSHLFVDAAEDGERTLVLKPTTAEPTRVAIGVQTFLLDPDGRPRLGAHDDGNRARADLVTIEPCFVLLDGDPVTVRVRLHAPAESGSAWAAIVLDVEPVEAAVANGTPVAVVTRVVVPVVVTRRTSEPSILAIEQVHAQAETDEIEVTAVLRNDGPTVIRTTAALTVEESGAEGRLEIAQGRIPNLVLFPGLPRLVRAHLAVERSAGVDRFVHIFVPAGERFFEVEVRPKPLSTRGQGAGSSAEAGTNTESPD